METGAGENGRFHGRFSIPRSYPVRPRWEDPDAAGAGGLRLPAVGQMARRTPDFHQVAREGGPDNWG